MTHRGKFDSCTNSSRCRLLTPLEVVEVLEVVVPAEIVETTVTVVVWVVVMT